MTLNPIFSREIQSRWRDARSFWLLFFLALALAVAAFFAYQAAEQLVEIAELQQQALQNRTSSRYPAYNYNPASGDIYFYKTALHPKYGEVIQEMNSRNVGILRFSTLDFNAAPPTPSQIGRAVFRILVLGNLLIFLVMAPALAATTIARERERGLLESLQLSPMKPLSQIAARLFSILCFLAILQIATIPTYGLAFTLGGISTPEIAVSLGAIALVAFSGSAFGLWISSRAHRPLGALWSVLGVIFAWSLISYGIWSSSFWRFGGFVAGQDWWVIAFYYALLLVLNFHPLAAFWAWSDPNSTLRELVLSDGIQVTRLVVGLGLVAGFLLLVLASRNANRILPPQQWGARNRFVEAWKKRIAAEKAGRDQKNQAKATVSEKLVADLPVEKLVRFRHPILAREVRARFRLRRVGLWASIGRYSLVLAFGMVWAFALFNLIWPDVRGFAPVVLGVVWAGGALLIALASSAAFTREREGGTWEGLRLALLSPREIVGAKWLSPLLTAIYYLAPLWILLPFYALRSVATGDIPGVIALLVGCFVALLSWGACSALGLWISWRAPSPVAAIGWTLATVAASHLLFWWMWERWFALSLSQTLLASCVLAGTLMGVCLGLVVRAIGQEKQR